MTIERRRNTRQVGVAKQVNLKEGVFLRELSPKSGIVERVEISME